MIKWEGSGNRSVSVREKLVKYEYSQCDFLKSLKDASRRTFSACCAVLSPCPVSMSSWCARPTRFHCLIKWNFMASRCREGFGDVIARGRTTARATGQTAENWTELRTQQDERTEPPSTEAKIETERLWIFSQHCTRH